MLTRLARFLALPLILASVSLGACADTGDTEGQASESELRAREGVTKLVDGSPITTDVAAGPHSIYVANQYRGVMLLDPSTMKVKQTWTRDSSGAQLRAEQLQVVGDTLMVVNMWNESADVYASPVTPARHELTIQFLDLETGATKKSIIIDIARALRLDPNDDFGDIPSMHVFAEGPSGDLFITYSHLHIPDRILTFKMPSAASTKFDFMSPPSSVRTITGIQNPKSIAVTSDRIYVTSPTSRSDGKLLVLDRSSGRQIGQATNLGYPIDVVVQGKNLIVGDAEGSVRVVDAQSLREVKRLDPGGFVDGIDATADQILATNRAGVFVAPAPR